MIVSIVRKGSFLVEMEEYFYINKVKNVMDLRKTECVVGFKFPCEECYYKICEDVYSDQEVVEDEELCDYTGDQCFGNPMFCEECPVFMGDD